MLNIKFKLILLGCISNVILLNASSINEQSEHHMEPRCLFGHQSENERQYLKEINNNSDKNREPFRENNNTENNDALVQKSVKRKLFDNSTKEEEVDHLTWIVEYEESIIDELLKKYNFSKEIFFDNNKALIKDASKTIFLASKYKMRKM